MIVDASVQSPPALQPERMSDRTSGSSAATSGFIAIGNSVTGFIAIGNVARGFIAIGNVAVGVIASGTSGSASSGGFGATVGPRPRWPRSGVLAFPVLGDFA